jgi:hypothetical protein
LFDFFSYPAFKEAYVTTNSNAQKYTKVLQRIFPEF